VKQPDPPADSTVTVCRLCGGPTAAKFDLPLMNSPRHCQYFECAQCGSLQTEAPDWLAQAYGGGNLSELDTGAALRVWGLSRLVWAVSKLLLPDKTAPKLLDFGGGDGLTCRLLRDLGFDAYSTDTYTRPTYGAGFEGPLQPGYDVITAFEVWEHLPQPQETLAEIFAQRPALHIATTQLFKGQGTDWWYLMPDSGQHVFFYSPKALRMVAERFGYHVLFGRGYHVFLREAPTRFQRFAIGRLLTVRRAESWARWAKAMSARYSGQDHDMLRRRRTNRS
jgi:hypothetical protein